MEGRPLLERNPSELSVGTEEFILASLPKLANRRLPIEPFHV